jgi:hypothetical protein
VIGIDGFFDRVCEFQHAVDFDMIIEFFIIPSLFSSIPGPCTDVIVSIADMPGTSIPLATNRS